MKVSLHFKLGNCNQVVGDVTMKNLSRLLIIIIVPLLLTANDETITISGQVTYFDGHPVDSCFVELKDRQFGTVASTHTDSSGYYQLHVPKGTYLALLAIRKDEYAVNKLEYWAWNIYAYSDLTINPRYDKLEIYAMNVFRPQGAYPSYFIYFRPMGLSRVLEIGPENIPNLELLDIAPDLEIDDITVTINDEMVDVFTVQRILEYAGKQRIYAYLVQTALPENITPDTQYDFIRLIVSDSEYGDRGEAMYMYDRKKYR